VTLETRVSVYVSNVMAQAGSPAVSHRLCLNGATSAGEITIFSCCNLSRARASVLLLYFTEIMVSEEICRTIVFFFNNLEAKKKVCSKGPFKNRVKKIITRNKF